MTAYQLTEAAEQDLNEAWDFVGQYSMNEADALAAEIHEALRLIAAVPGIGHRRADVADARYRFWRVNRYIIAYFPETRPVQIIRIVGAKRDFRKIFRRDRKR
jgi:antitoxin ParD1/3/4/toxin ParE1/3/4